MRLPLPPPPSSGPIDPLVAEHCLSITHPAYRLLLSGLWKRPSTESLHRTIPLSSLDPPPSSSHHHGKTLSVLSLATSAGAQGALPGSTIRHPHTPTYPWEFSDQPLDLGLCTLDSLREDSVAMAVLQQLAQRSYRSENVALADVLALLSQIDPILRQFTSPSSVVSPLPDTRPDNALRSRNVARRPSSTVPVTDATALGFDAAPLAARPHPL